MRGSTRRRPRTGGTWRAGRGLAASSPRPSTRRRSAPGASGPRRSTPTRRARTRCSSAPSRPRARSSESSTATAGGPVRTGVPRRCESQPLTPSPPLDLPPANQSSNRGSRQGPGCVWCVGACACVSTHDRQERTDSKAEGEEREGQRQRECILRGRRCTQAAHAAFLKVPARPAGGP